MVGRRKVGLAAGAALAALACAGAAVAQDAPAPGGGAVVDAIAAGKLILEVRARYEGVDQANLRNDADAFTVRTRLGWETAPWNDLKGLIEFEDVRSLGGEDYNSTVNGRVLFPVIVDPEVTELNRLQLTWAPSKEASVTVGRQRILLDDQRFVGSVAWRQDEQTFDALRGDLSLGRLQATYAFIGRVNRIFGEAADWDSESHILNAAYTVSPAFKAVGFLYALDFDNSPVNSTVTAGVRVSGAVKPGPFGLSYAASYGSQEDYGSNPADFTLDYWSAEGAATYGPVTAKLSYEALEGSGTRGFATPLATLHAFQGWADVFLVTPANGIEDVALAVTYKAPFKSEHLSGLALMVVAHDFEAERTGADLGSEVDVQLSAKFGARTTGVVKYADYDGVPGFPSRSKLWLGIEFKL